MSVPSGNLPELHVPTNGQVNEGSCIHKSAECGLPYRSRIVVPGQHLLTLGAWPCLEDSGIVMMLRMCKGHTTALCWVEAGMRLCMQGGWEPTRV